MPGVRSEGQTMIGCWCHKALVDKIDRARRARTRSEFCRGAIAEKLRAMGLDVPESEAASPDRTGKGGPKRMVYPIARQAVEFNEPGSTSKPAPAKPAPPRKRAPKSKRS